MQFHPLSISPLVYSGKGRGGGDETEKKRERSPLINLELEVGGFGGQSCVIKQEEENILFTAAQFHELYLQVVIFKYLSSGLPVPFHLVLPIWKSVASSLGCGFSPQEFVHGSMMDPEPGRCRRTDGKKWRCHSSVVPDQKYCARHMHRGSQRSRKLVEASKDILKSNTEALISDKSKSPIISSGAAVTNGRISVPISTSLDLAITSATVGVGSTSISYNSNSEGSSTNIVQIDGGAATSSLLTAQAGKNNTRNESNWNDSPALGFDHFSTSKTYQCNQGNKSSAKPSIAAGFGVSPKSVLQSGIGTGCINLSLDKIGMETEALRCRRTDGKRWRCSRDVVPYKKYCANHMYRGAKKATLDSKSVTGVPGASSARIAGAYGMPGKIKNCRNLNTNLSISIAASPQPTLDSDSNSSSEATTVSDENARVSHFLTLSP